MNKIHFVLDWANEKRFEHFLRCQSVEEWEKLKTKLLNYLDSLDEDELNDFIHFEKQDYEKIVPTFEEANNPINLKWDGFPDFECVKERWPILKVVFGDKNDMKVFEELTGMKKLQFLDISSNEFRSN